MFSIGDFSRITGLTVKALRFYHEEGLLIPRFVDEQTGYRYYDPSQMETARVIVQLRQLDLPVSEIKELLGDANGGQVLDVLERHKTVLQARAKHVRTILKSLDQFISEEREARAMSESMFAIEEKILEPTIVAGIRVKGAYRECGAAFGKLGRRYGGLISGKPFLLHYDTEYREDDADFEACMPIQNAKQVDGISVRELTGGKCVTLVHKGLYEQLGHSYSKILQYFAEKKYEIRVPTREVYLKGPGMIFRGNPKNYLTEIQMLITAPS